MPVQTSPVDPLDDAPRGPDLRSRVPQKEGDSTLRRSPFQERPQEGLLDRFGKPLEFPAPPIWALPQEEMS